MDAWLNGARLRLSDSDLLGEGGEARVYRFGHQAVKLFHAPSQLKAQKLAAFPKGLPPEVVAPSGTVTDPHGAVIGYAMPAVLGHEELARLSNRRFRDGVVPNARVLELFDQLGALLSALHARGVIAGDLNDGNVLFDTGLKLIDADSMQYAGLPCVVGHERTLAPELYGADLTAGPKFTAATDWYAWNVLLFSSLLYVHPYGGVHPKLGTLLRRAEAKHSVLRSDVTYPRSAAHFRVLPDDVLHHFERVFDRGERTAAVPQLPGGGGPRSSELRSLTRMDWTKCSCGLEHARAACPDCQTRGPAAARQAIRSHGRCSARSMFSTTGRVLEAAMQGGLRYVYEENGVVRREDGSLVLDGPAPLGTRFAIAGASTWVADRGGQLARVHGGKVVERASTGVRGTAPVMTAAYRVEQEWIVDQQSGARLGQILEGQTWLWSGERLGLGLYRAGDVTQVFLLERGKPGLKPVRHVPGGRGPVVALKGRLVDAACAFDDGHALLSATCELDGRETRELWLFNAAGQCLAGKRGLTPFPRCALLGGRVVCATDGGLLSLRIDSGVLVEGTLFTDSEPFVAAGDELLAQPDGSLIVVSHNEIVQLSLSLKENVMPLPLPDHYDPKQVPQLYLERGGLIADAAEAYAKKHGIKPAGQDKTRIAAFGIDVQVGFCTPGASLFVPGAVEDTQRTVEWLYRNLDQLTGLFFSMDTHRVFQIFHPAWWVDAKGQHPAPFTPIFHEEVRAGKWTAVSHPKESIEYCKRLEAAGKYVLTIWPYHTLLGGLSHALVPAVMEAALFHAHARRHQTHFETKGTHAMTENYSVLSPEVTEVNGQVVGAFNAPFFKMLLEYDRVYVFGQAKSHCVLSTLNDLQAHLDPKLAGKIFILEDAMSPVPPPPLDPLPDSLNFPRIAEKAIEQWRAAGMNVVKTSDPVTV